MMVHSVCEALQDDNILTQRASLDILIYCFPLLSLPVSKSDVRTIMSSAVYILLRRDMSLNRRLYFWLLGIEPNKAIGGSSTSIKEQKYFETISKPILLEALLDMLEKEICNFSSRCCVNTLQSISGSEISFIRVLISLLDKSEVGPVIINDLMTSLLCMIEAVASSYKSALSQENIQCKKCSFNPKAKANCQKSHSEFIKSVNLFFNSFETDFIWNFVADMFEKSCERVVDAISIGGEEEKNYSKKVVTYSQLCSIIESLLHILSLETYVEITTDHLPQLLNKCFIGMTKSCRVLSSDQIVTGLNLCQNIMKHVQPFQPGDLVNHNEDEHQIMKCAESVQEFLISFITEKLLNEETRVEDFMVSLLENKDEDLCYASRFDVVSEPAVVKSNPVQFKDNKKKEVTLQAFKDSCKLLIDICCFPTLCRGNSNSNVVDSCERESEIFPRWAVYLLACACCSNYDVDCISPMDFSDIEYFTNLTITGCSTVLELMTLTSSYQMESASASKSSIPGESSVVSVVVPPPLTNSNLKWINEKTNFFQQVCRILWAELGYNNTITNVSAYHRTYSKLLIHLHQLCPTEAVERLLLEDILSPTQTARVAAIKKFSVLWHCTRDYDQNFHGTTRGNKSLNRCLLAILDQLNTQHSFLSYNYLPYGTSSQAMVSTTVTTWLRQSLEDGDICRILEPHILLALHAQTNRKPLHSVLKYKKKLENMKYDAGLARQLYSAFLKQRNTDSIQICEDCASVQKEIGDDDCDMKHRLSIDTMNSLEIDLAAIHQHMMCKVHRQMAEERNQYEHVVALLTLSDEMQPDTLELDTCRSKDLQIWVAAFVQEIIDDGLKIYRSELQTESTTTEASTDSDGHAAVEALEKSYFSSDSNASHAAEAIELNESFLEEKHPLYKHILIYQERFDAARVLYSLQSILTVASTHPRLFMKAACTTSLASHTPHSNLVQELMIRHERSLDCEVSFYKPAPLSSRGAIRNRMVVEVLISVCLNYMKSTFDSESRKLKSNYLNHDIQCMAIKLLSHIVKELTALAQEDSSPITQHTFKTSSTTPQFSAYIVSVLQRYQVQSSVLSCLLTTILSIKDTDVGKDYSSGEESEKTSESQDSPLHQDDQLLKTYLERDKLQATTLFSQYLSLTFELIKLEHFAFPANTKSSSQDLTTPPSILLNKRQVSDQSQNKKKAVKRSSRIISHLLSLSYQYDSDLPLIMQKVFISTLLEIYKLENFPELHLDCSALLNSVLPYLASALPDITIPIIYHQCLNLENKVKRMYFPSSTNLPPNYIDSTLRTLTVLTHYCLLNASDDLSMTQNEKIVGITSGGQSIASGSSIGTGLHTLFNVFGASSSAKSNKTNSDGDRQDGLSSARVAVLNNLARIVSCLCLLWKTMVSGGDKANAPPEEAKSVSYNILRLLGPLSMQYGEYLLVAFTLVWQNRDKDKDSLQVDQTHATDLLAEPNVEQRQIVEMLLALKPMSVEMFLSFVKQVMKSPPSVANSNTCMPLQENILKILLHYMKSLKASVLSENWSFFLAILQETLALGSTQTSQNSVSVSSSYSPNCHFLSLYLLSEYVKRVPSFPLKKDQRDMQDIVGKCIETCNVIAGSSLEQGTWIRRNVSVLPGPQVPDGGNKIHKKTESQSSMDLSDLNLLENDTAKDLPPRTASSDTVLNSSRSKNDFDQCSIEKANERPQMSNLVSNTPVNPINFRNSVKSLTIMSEVVANLLDVIYGSEEKDKVLPILTAIISNVTPYLRNHNSDNVPSFRSCIAFLSSISGFQHTRRAWRKDILELFLDPLFFNMPADCIDGWLTIIDHLMTHDKTTFKEVMSRMSLSRSGPSAPSLNIFSNKEQELELRALNIKRLSFIIFSSEVDQYQKHLPEIQERLAESLRFHNVPGIQSQVFLCFRVLLLRVSPNSLTSLWPTIFTELVHVMLQLEQSLEPEAAEDNNSSTKAKQKSRSSATSPTVPVKNVMSCWLEMYISACKMLDLALCLPIHYVPMFQLYRWSFVGEVPESQNHGEVCFQSNGPSVRNGSESEEEDDNKVLKFVPHCVRIQKLFCKIYPKRASRTIPVVPEKPMLSSTRIRSIEQLQLFFNTIVTQNYLLDTQSSSARLSSNARFDSNSLPHIEKVVQREFVSPML